MEEVRTMSRSKERVVHFEGFWAVAPVKSLMSGEVERVSSVRVFRDVDGKADMYTVGINAIFYR